MPSIPPSAAVSRSDLDRVVVLGTSGAGKSTFARRLANRLGCPHVELDLIQWLPGWVGKDRDQFRREVSEATAGPRWVVDGNYIHIRDLVWTRATTIIWLDYSFPIIFWRALRRTVARVVTQETILNGNRESIRVAFLSRYGIPWWVVRTYRLRKREFGALFASGDFAHARVIVLKRPQDAERFLAETFAAADV